VSYDTNCMWRIEGKNNEGEELLRIHAQGIILDKAREMLVNEGFEIEIYDLKSDTHDNRHVVYLDGGGMCRSEEDVIKFTCCDLYEVSFQARQLHWVVDVVNNSILYEKGFCRVYSWPGRLYFLDVDFAKEVISHIEKNKEEYEKRSRKAHDDFLNNFVRIKV